MNPDAPLDRAAQLIRSGRLVAFPTETVYGLGANALDPVAVARIFEVKGRPRFDPLIVHVADIDTARLLVLDWPDEAQRLTERFWPGPLTLVLPKRDIVPDIVTAGLPTVAVRIPDHPIALELIRRAGVPIAAPSANRFGEVSPTTAEHVRDSLSNEVDLILDGGPCRAGIESTVIALPPSEVNGEGHGGGPTLLRTGALTVEEIEEVVALVERPGTVAPGTGSPRPTAPGQLARHYATRTPLYLRGSEPPGLDPDRVGRLCFRAAPREPGGAVEVLSPTGDLRIAAANLFAAMRRLDGLGLEAIVADLAPPGGLGLAINDRLRRAGRG